MAGSREAGRLARGPTRAGWHRDPADQRTAGATQGAESRLLELEAKRDACERGLKEQGDQPPAPALHPGLAEVYRRKVAKLETALNDPSIQPEASGVLRGLIDAVVLHPGDRRGEVRAELRGEIAALMRLGAAKQQKTRVLGTRVSLVAGKRNQRYLQAFRAMIPSLPHPAADPGEHPSSSGR